MARPARLTGALLVRKGDALPTAGFAHAGLDLVPPQPSAARLEQQRCGTSRPRGALPPDLPTAQKPNGRATRADQERVAFTVRLDRERHKRLRILRARRGTAGQEILIKALDAYLEACATDCACPRGAATAEPAAPVRRTAATLARGRSAGSISRSVRRAHSPAR